MMERSFAALAGFEHEAEMVTGWADLAESAETQSPLTPEATYASAVLALSDSDEGQVDGQEGFLDKVKRGASKVYEWIKSIIRAIRDWFSGNNRKEYEAARTEIKDIDLEEDLEEELENTVETLFSSSADRLIKDVVNRADTETKQVIKESVAENVEKLVNDTERKDRIIGTIVNEVASKVSSRLKQVDTRISEINRIDPNGETLDKLSLESTWKYISSMGESVTKSFDVEDQSKFASNVKSLVTDAEDIQHDLSVAVRKLEKMNEAARHEADGSENRSVARAGSIVKEFSEIAAIYRDIIITISSQVQIGFKKAETSIVKDALSEALKHSDGPANKYIQQAIDSL